MKISVIITTILITQVTASFFDVFQGAVLSVQNSFGKLLTDVVTDVRDTVDCTILAVEHVLALSNDATAQYYDKCGNGNKADSASGSPQDERAPKVEVSLEFSNKKDNLQKEVPVDIYAKINETLSKILGNYKTRDNSLSVENMLAKESEQLADVSKLVKQELNKLSNDVRTDLTIAKVSEPSVDTILQEIKLLENKEQYTKNTSEATEIHKVIDEVLTKLHVIEVTEASENIKLDEILRNLENNSNNSFIGLRQQFEEWKEIESRHLSDIKNKIEEHEKETVVHEYIYQNLISNNTPPVQLNPGTLKSIKPSGIEGPSEEKPIHTKIVLKESNNNAASKLTEGNESVQMKDMHNNITKSSETGNEVKETSLTSIKNDPPIRAYTIIDQMMNDTATSGTAAGTIATSTYSTNTTIQEKGSNVSNDTSARTVDNETTRLVETTMGSKDRESSLIIISPKTAINNNDLNETLTKNSVKVTETISQGRVVHSVEINATFNEEEISATTNAGLTPVTIANIISKKENDIRSTNGTETELSLTTQISSNTDILNFSTMTSTAVPILETVKTERAAYIKPSSFNSNEMGTVELLTVNHSDDTVTSTSIQNINESGTVTPVENNTASADRDSNDTVIMKMLSPIIPSTSISKAMQSVENIPVFGNGESSVAINNFTTSAVTIDKNAFDNITTNVPLTFIVGTHLTDFNQLAEAMETSTVEEPLTSVPIPNANIIDVSVFTSSSRSILGNIFVENTTSAENEESSTTTTYRGTNENVVSSTIFVTSETTPIGEIILPDKSTKLIENEESTSLTTTQPADILNKITIYNNDQKDAGTTPHLITKGALANRNKQAVEFGANLESQELTSTLGAVTSTVFTLTEKTDIKHETTLPIKSTTRNAEYRDVYTLTTNPIMTTPQIYNLNHVVTNRPTFALTVDPFMNMNTPLLHKDPTKRPWLPQRKRDMSPNKLNPKMYPNINRVPRKHNYLNIPQSLKDRGSYLNPAIPRRKSSIPARNLYQDPYFAPTIKKEDVTRGPERRNNINRPSVQIPKSRIQPPYSWGDGLPNINISPTYRPVTIVTPKANNNNNKPSPDYDSFFHNSQTNNEAHQRALREARELIENSKRSHRIIDTILKNKNHYGARSIFNNPGTLNTGVI